MRILFVLADGLRLGSGKIRADGCELRQLRFCQRTDQANFNESLHKVKFDLQSRPQEGELREVIPRLTVKGEFVVVLAGGEF